MISAGLAIQFQFGGGGGGDFSRGPRENPSRRGVFSHRARLPPCGSIRLFNVMLARSRSREFTVDRSRAPVENLTWELADKFYANGSHRRT